MSRRFNVLSGFSFALLASLALSICSTATADVISVDVSQVDASAIPLIRQAESIWEARIQAYSREIPRAIRDQLSSLTISATVAPVDGVGGILGFAGPDAVLTVGNTDRSFAVAVSSSMTFDLDDFPSMLADGILLSVIVHEMGHALGFGTLFEGNGLIGPLGGFGATQYIGGKYAISGYRKDIGNPAVAFVPLEQRGGPGTALGHWADVPPFFNQVFTPAFTKELMTGFACDIVPGTDPIQIVCAPTFISEATWGAMADVGFAVQGFNEALAAPRGLGTGRWPKITGATTNPFGLNGVRPAAGLQFSRATVKAVYKASRNSQGAGVEHVDTVEAHDPYNLRKHRWAK